MLLNEIGVFLCVCETKSITKAAEVLNLAQPTVSSAIKRLENEMTAKLLIRRKGKIEITEAGMLLYEKTKHFPSVVKDVKKSIQAISDNASTLMGAIASIAEIAMPKGLLLFQKKYPDTCLQVKVESHDGLMKMIQMGDISFALTDSFPEDRRFTAIPLQTYPLVGIAGHNFKCPDRIPLEKLWCYPMILREKGTGQRDSIDQYCDRNGIQMHPVVETASNLALLRMVQEGVGIGIVSFDFVQRQIEQGVFRKIIIDGLAAPRQFYLVYWDINVSDRDRNALAFWTNYLKEQCVNDEIDELQALFH